MMITKRPLSYWVKTSSIRLQAALLIVIAVTVFVRVLPLELQKRIINKAIGLKEIDLLLTYCALYLAAVVVAGGLKFAINAIQTYISQHALAKIRKELYSHILSLPLSFFRQASSGMVVSSVVTEVVAASEFVGQAVAVPVTNLLTLMAFAGYMFYLNPLLAGLSIVIYPLILLIIPSMQKRSNKANKERVDITRTLSSRIGETVSGIHEVHANAGYEIENRKYGRLVDELLKVRVVWNLYKFGIKAINNFFQNLGPFILFVVGGYLTIKGRFDLGALVAFLSTYEKIYDPWKELMDFYQTYQDAHVSYKRLMEYFDYKPQHALKAPDRPPLHLDGNIQIKELTFSTPGGTQLLKGIHMDLKRGEQLALVGFSGSGKTTLIQCIAQLYSYTGGSILIDDQEVSGLTKYDIAQNVGIVSQTHYIFDGTIRENLLYSCESLVGKDDGPLPTVDEMIEVVQQVGLFIDVLRFGLEAILPIHEEEELVSRLIRVRENFQKHFSETLRDDVEFFDEHRYLYFSSIATNLTFGNANIEAFSQENLSTNSYFLDFLDKVQLKMPLIHLGRELAIQAIDILGDLPPDEVFFEQSPISIEELNDYKKVSAHAKDLSLSALTEDDRSRLLKLALRFNPGTHKMVDLPQILEPMILEGRFLFMKKIQAERPDAITFYRMSDYIHSQTILDNILFGKARTERPKAQENIYHSIIQLLIEEDLLEKILEIGMHFNVGTKGDRLSGGQRQKLAIARVLLKKPSILIMDEATSGLDNASQKRIQNLLDTKWKGRSTIISVVHRLEMIKDFEKVAVMKGGKIVEIGTYDELMAKKGMLFELVGGGKTSARRIP